MQVNGASGALIRWVGRASPVVVSLSVQFYPEPAQPFFVPAYGLACLTLQHPLALFAVLVLAEVCWRLDAAQH